MKLVELSKEVVSKDADGKDVKVTKKCSAEPEQVALMVKAGWKEKNIAAKTAK